jgi:kynurenine formamidase
LIFRENLPTAKNPASVQVLNTEVFCFIRLDELMRIIDLSYTIETGMPTFGPQAPQPIIKPWMSHSQAAASGHYEECTCEVTEVNFITSLGTYLDSPYHFHPNRQSIEQLQLEQLILLGIVIDCTDAQKHEPIEPHVLDGLDISGKAVLFHTNWSHFWGKSEYYDSPFLSEATAQVLVNRNAKLAGVDFLVIDDLTDPRRPVHVTLLKNDILIVENLTGLRQISSSIFVFHAVPVKVKGAAAFPVRAYAVINE